MPTPDQQATLNILNNALTAAFESSNSAEERVRQAQDLAAADAASAQTTIAGLNQQLQEVAPTIADLRKQLEQAVIDRDQARAERDKAQQDLAALQERIDNAQQMP